MDAFSGSGVAAPAGLGVVAGLYLLGRGLGGYRSLIRVSDTSTSTISSLAAGEVRITGAIEPAELTLVSLLQSVPCVYYRSTIGDAGERGGIDPAVTEERAIGFRIRDATGEMRVFPRGARFDAPVRFEGETSLTGDEPAGLVIRLEGSTQPTETDRATAMAALLTVRDPGGLDATARSPRWAQAAVVPGVAAGAGGPRDDRRSGTPLLRPRRSRRGGPRIRAGRARGRPGGRRRHRRARATGSLADDPMAAWGNAAIAGFGIGRPVTRPAIDPAASPLPLAEPSEAARIERTFEIAPETLVLAASDEVPLLIAHGVPGAVVERGQDRFLLGLLGAILAIASAMIFAVDLGGGLGR